LAVAPATTALIVFALVCTLVAIVFLLLALASMIWTIVTAHD
jgi:hypothetical protein